MNHNFFTDIKLKLDNIALIRENNHTDASEDVIRVNVPAFLRIIELIREEIQDDVPLHRLTEILSRLSKTDTITMEDYEAVYQYTMQNSQQEENQSMGESREMMTEEQFDEAAGKKDACYHKVKRRYKVWPSAYASGALVQCRKVGAKNWGNKSKK